MSRILPVLLTFWMPIKRIRRRWRTALSLRMLHRLQERRFHSLLNSSQRIRLTFLVVRDSTITFAPLIRKAANDARFDVSVFVVPDVCRGHDNQVKEFRKALEACERNFGDICRVRSAYDVSTDAICDIASDCDMAVTNCPYTGMLHRLHSVRYLAEHGVLPVFVSYGFFVSRYSVDETFRAEAFDYCWRVFVDTPENLADLKACSKINGSNLRLTGFCRMDDFVFSSQLPEDGRRRIIIAPHHTVAGSELKLSNFLRYADFFLTLPGRYPHVDWVFRPHPLLFAVLRNEGLWSEDRIAAYKQALNEFPNMRYEDGGPYLETFARSDAMIHDCGSFLAEYLYMERPACFMMRDEIDPGQVFSRLGLECLKACQIARKEHSILEFIDRIVDGGRDDLAEVRRQVVSNSLKFNHPDVAGVQVKMLKGEIS